MENELQYHTLPFVNFRYKLVSRDEVQKYLDEIQFTEEFNIPPKNEAMVHSFERGAHDITCLVMLGDMEDISPRDIMIYLTHESVHVKQRYMNLLNEDEPSIEFEAYTVDKIFNDLLSDFYAMSDIDEMSNPIQSIIDWFDIAKPEPTVWDLCVQYGCHLEEVAETLNSTGDDEFIDDLNEVAEFYKQKYPTYTSTLGNLTDEQKVELLDGLCDTIVTSVGTAHLAGFDLVGALNEVIKSNWSKFENGEAVYDDNGKIAKGSHYFKPDLKRFINKQ